MIEEWRIVPSLTVLEASSLGRVRVAATGELLTMTLAANGYYRLSIKRWSKRATTYVHRLVCEAFHGPSELPFVRHLNGRRTENLPSNLAWGTRQDNADDMVRLGECARGVKHGRAKLSAESAAKIRDDIRRECDIAAEYGISKSLVGQIRRQEIWK